MVPTNLQGYLLSSFWSHFASSVRAEPWLPAHYAVSYSQWFCFSMWPHNLRMFPSRHCLLYPDLDDNSSFFSLLPSHSIFSPFLLFFSSSPCLPPSLLIFLLPSPLLSFLLFLGGGGRRTMYSMKNSLKAIAIQTMKWMLLAALMPLYVFHWSQAPPFPRNNDCIFVIIFSFSL